MKCSQYVVGGGCIIDRTKIKNPKLILDRRRDLINDRPSRAAAAEAPLDGAQERHHFDNPTKY